VFPSMIENVVSQHPAVHQCSVVGCADKEHVQGRLPFVYLVLDPAVPAAKRKQIIKELRQLCIEELPEYVQPVGYKIIPEMPLTLAAKFDYRKLEEEITPRDY
jgi:long-chain-fatty-acid--coA ligase